MELRSYVKNIFAFHYLSRINLEVSNKGRKIFNQNGEMLQITIFQYKGCELDLVSMSRTKRIM